MQDKDQKTLNEQYGGVHGLAAALGSDKKSGLAEEAVEGARLKHGANTYTQVPPKSFFAILYEGFKDPVILLLCAAATVSTIMACRRSTSQHASDWSMLDEMAMDLVGLLHSC